MPFVARHKDTKERIDITRIENPRQVLKSGDYICQLCDTPMIVKAGLIMQAHFAHTASCTSDYQSHPESQEHREAKIFLAKNLGRSFAEYTNTTIEYEVPIPEVKRIADLLVTFPMGWRIAHEVQLASITSQTLQERTDDYARAGIDVVWWLGKSANTPTNRDWSRKIFGYALCINIA